VFVVKEEGSSFALGCIDGRTEVLWLLPGEVIGHVVTPGGPDILGSQRPRSITGEQEPMSVRREDRTAIDPGRIDRRPEILCGLPGSIRARASRHVDVVVSTSARPV